MKAQNTELFKNGNGNWHQEVDELIKYYFKESRGYPRGSKRDGIKSDLILEINKKCKNLDLPDKTWDSIKSRAKTIRAGSWGAKKEELLAKEGILEEKFLVLTSKKGCTVKEITAALEIDEKKAGELLDKKYPGFRHFKEQNVFQEEVHIFRKESLSLKPKGRIFTHKWQTESQPYLVFKFPDNSWKKIVIVPLSDLLVGSEAHDSSKFNEYIDYIRQKENVFAFFNGDIIEPVPKDPSVAREDFNFLEYADNFIRQIEPIAHKILWAQSGEKEEKVWKKFGIDPLRYVCDAYDIPHSHIPLFVDISWLGHLFTFFCFHGRTTAIKAGTKLNAALRPLEFQEHVMFTIMGHAQDSNADEIMRECRDPARFRIEKKSEFVVICPSFRDYFKTEAFKKGYPPPASGTISCRLYRDGSYGTSS